MVWQIPDQMQPGARSTGRVIRLATLLPRCREPMPAVGRRTGSLSSVSGKAASGPGEPFGRNDPPRAHGGRSPPGHMRRARIRETCAMPRFHVITIKDGYSALPQAPAAPEGRSDP